MKTLIFSVVAVVFLGHAAVADTYVRGHYRSDGTYVQPSVQPNVNPYTGQLGTKQPTWNDQAPPSNSLYSGSNRARW